MNFKEGDLVLQKINKVRKEKQHGKLVASWEGLYQISYVLGKWAYRLEDLAGNFYLRFGMSHTLNKLI